MRVVGKNANRAGITRTGLPTRAIQLIPQGIKPSGRAIVVHAVARGVWHDAKRNEYRQLRYGQTVRSAVVVNANKFNTLQKKAAASKIQAAWRTYRNFSESVVENPLVKAALSSKYMVHITGHGALFDGTFVVPRNVVVVFTTTPGASSYSLNTSTISMNRVRKMILGKDTSYTVPYFEGDTVSDHILSFEDPHMGIFQILPENVRYTSEYHALPETYEPRSLKIRHTAWKKAANVTTNSSSRLLSELVRYLARVHALQKPREPLVLVVSTCRGCFNPNKNLDGHVARNVAARRRVSGPGYTLPSKMQNLKRMGETSYLTKLYREMQKNEYGTGNNEGPLQFIKYLRGAGLLNKKFNKATVDR